jgi:hypothetical protein
MSAKRGNFPCPAISRAGSHRALSGSVFNEGVSVPRADWAGEVRQDPALASPDKHERFQAVKRSILSGSLAKYRRR